MMKRTDRWRPAPAGISISHPMVTAGSLGCYLWLDGRAYIVSNAHVIADAGLASLGDDVTQPGSADGGNPPEDTIAHLSFFVPYVTDSPNKLDLALAEAVPDIVDDRILGLEPGAKVMEVVPSVAQEGDRVWKSGRTTGLSYGTIISTDARIEVGGFPQGMLVFEDCLMVEGKVSGGDSGSAVIAVADGSLLGLLFCGSEYEAVYGVIKIQNIIEALGQAPQFRGVVGIGDYKPQAKWLVPMLFGGIVVGDIAYFLGKRG